VRSPPPEEEEVAETMCDELTVTLIPCPSAPLGGRRERNGSEIEPGKRERWREDILRSSFISRYSTLI